jgi:pilus assembly protein CpaC
VSPLGIVPVGTSGVALGVPSPNPAVTVFGHAVLGNSALDYFINALRQNNLMRVLAEPNLVATSGQEASFLAGGEFPIPITQGGGSAQGVAVTVEFKEFGVKLKMTPVVLGSGRVKINVAPEVSDLDFTTAVRFNGFTIPGLTSRKLNTTVELNEGQTFAIGGLLNHSISAQKDVTPLLGDIPVLGALFRSVRYQKKETELVVLVTPHVVAGLNPAQVPDLPGEHWRDPSEVDLFLNQDLGNSLPPRHAGSGSSPFEATSKPTTATVQGAHGFIEDAVASRQKNTSDSQQQPQPDAVDETHKLAGIERD